MTTDSTKAMTPMQALAQIAEGTGLSKHDMQDLAALAYNTAQRDARLAAREVTTWQRARAAHSLRQAYADYQHWTGGDVDYRDIERGRSMAGVDAVIKELGIQADRQRGCVVGLGNMRITKEWLKRKLEQSDDSNCEAGILHSPSCLTCGNVGNAAIFNAERPDIYVCTECQALFDQRDQAREGWRDTVSRVLTVLDKATGDTDPNIDPDMTDDEVRDEYPEIWACQQLAGLLAAVPPPANQTQGDK